MLFVLDKSIVTLGYWKKGVRLRNRPCDCRQQELAGSQRGSQTRLPQDTSTKMLNAESDSHLNLTETTLWVEWTRLNVSLL